jgi:hypothetical protein
VGKERKGNFKEEFYNAHSSQIGARISLEINVKTFIFRKLNLRIIIVNPFNRCFSKISKL